MGSGCGLNQGAGPFLAAVLSVVVGVGCDSKPSVMVFHADSLATPFDAIEKAFELKYPDLDLQREVTGSVMAANKIVSLNRQADVIAVADYLVIENMLKPRYTDWLICFATNEVVIGKTQASKYRNELNADNWYEILLRDDVTVQAANPDHDPAGYWTELAWKLADLHYGKTGAESIYDRFLKKLPREERVSDAQQMLSRLQSDGGIDYAFVYRNQAEAHRLGFQELPDEINLSESSHSAFYDKVSIEIAGREPGTTQTKRGHPIIFAISALKEGNNPEGGRKFVEFVLSDEGKAILRRNYVPVPDPMFTFDLASVPEGLRAGISELPEPGSSVTSEVGGKGE